MALKIYPGAKIYSAAGHRSTFTCFVRKPAQPNKLFGMTARHCLPTGTTCYCEDNGGAAELGGSAEHAASLDVCIFAIKDSVAKQLSSQNFIPRGFGGEFKLDWDPGKLAAKVAGAATATAEEQLKAKTMNVVHLGFPSYNGAPTGGVLAKFTSSGMTQITQTSIQSGDSGGPLIHQAKVRYVGLISRGDTQGTSTSGDIVVMRAALQALNVEITTWGEKNLWLPP